METNRELPPSYEKSNATSATESAKGWDAPPISAPPSGQRYMPLDNSHDGQSQNPYMPQNSYPPMGSPYGHYAPQPIPSAQAPAVNVHAVTVSTGAAVPGSCPVCHSTRGFRKGFTCCGYLWCICCFPCGIICCLTCNMETSCRNCNFKTN